MDTIVGVIGGAAVDPDADTRARVARLGRTIAERGCTVVAASQPGLSRVAAEAARAAGSRVIHVRPLERIPRPGSPSSAAPDAPSGDPGDPDAEDEAIRCADIVVIVGGRFGSPGGLATAYAERRPIGVLTQTRGVADAIEALVRVCAKPDAGPVLCDDAPIGWWAGSSSATDGRTTMWAHLGGRPMLRRRQGP